MRLLVTRLVERRRPNAVAALDLVGIPDVLAGEDACVRAQAAHLVVQPRRRLPTLAQQGLGLGDERCRVGERPRTSTSAASSGGP